MRFLFFLTTLLTLSINVQAAGLSPSDQITALRIIEHRNNAQACELAMLKQGIDVFRAETACQTYREYRNDIPRLAAEFSAAIKAVDVAALCGNEAAHFWELFYRTEQAITDIRTTETRLHQRLSSSRFNSGHFTPEAQGAHRDPS